MLERRPPRVRARAGFSLVEVVVALTLFAVLMSTLAVATIPVVRGATRGVASAQRAAALMRKLNQLEVLSFDSLPGRAGCASVGAPTYPRTECVRVVNVSSQLRRVTILVTPSDTLFRPDSVSFHRAKAVSANPLNTP